MSIAKLKISGREYVVLPRTEYEKLLASEENRRDAAAARRALGRLRAGKSRAVPLETVKRELGMR